MRKTKSPPHRVYGIILAELTRLGDLISALPAVRQIIRHYPEAITHFYVQERFAPLVRAFSLGAEVHGVRDSLSLGSFARAIQEVRGSSR